MKKILLVLIVVALAVACVGCSGGNSIEGTWRQSDEMIDEMMDAYKSVVDVSPEDEEKQREEFKNEMVIVFKGDGSATLVANHNNETSEEDMAYELDGDKLTIGEQQLTIKDGVIYREDGVPMLVKD